MLGCIFIRKSIRVSYCTILDMVLIKCHNRKLAADSTVQLAAPSTESLPPNDPADTPVVQLDTEPIDDDRDGS